MVQFGCLCTSHYVYIPVSRKEKDQRKLGLLYLGTFLEVSQKTSAWVVVKKQSPSCKGGWKMLSRWS